MPELDQATTLCLRRINFGDPEALVGGDYFEFFGRLLSTLRVYLGYMEIWDTYFGLKLGSAWV